ncbi:MAG TPA: DegQ family serine endoprotease [Nitrospiria bacterium]
MVLRESQGRNRVILSGLLILMGIVIGVVVSTHLDWLPFGQAESEDQIRSALPSFPPNGPELSFMEISKTVTPAVVNISSTRVIKRPGGGGGGGQAPLFDDPFFRRFFGDEFFRQFQMPRQHQEQSLGSGVIVDPEGYIVTNNHVVEQASEIKVFLSNRQEYKGKLVGSDPKSDVAVIKIEGKNDFPSAVWGNSDFLQVGEYVLAIGNPFGLNQTVTMGIISAVGRANVGIADYEDFIQTDAAINPGNSGGALVNIRGEVIGINTAIFTRSGGYQGIGFAVPSNMAQSVMNSLIKTGKVVRGWLGVSIQEISPELGKQFGVEELKGALVSDVFPDSPAHDAGLERGDVILEYQEKIVKSVSQLRNMVAQTTVGTKVELKVLRDQKEKIFKVKIGDLPKDLTEARLGEEVVPEEMDNVLNGLEVQELAADIIRQLDLPKEIQGVVVSNVTGDTRVERSGLQRGDVIQEIDRKKIRSMKDYQKVVSSLKKDKTILLLVFREGRTFFVTVSSE